MKQPVKVETSLSRTYLFSPVNFDANFGKFHSAKIPHFVKTTCKIILFVYLIYFIILIKYY
jgi:hypothetical protein